ncbi:hypothetical protein KEM60_00686 [Austwickia sp. TVS 96-490-7B]|nr:hypothetical protein [Austwickia sp. TVS 96-490-7B]
MGWREFFDRAFRATTRKPRPTPWDSPSRPKPAVPPATEDTAARREDPPEQEVNTLVAPLATAHPLRDLDPAALRAALRLRLVDLDSLTRVEGLPHLRAIAPGLVEVLTIDLPHVVITPTAADLARLGPIPAQITLGRKHLHRLLDEDLSVHHVSPEDGLSFTVVRGEDYCFSSVALILPTLIHAVAPELELSRGLFVAVPDRHHVAFREIAGLESVMSLGPMATFTRHGYDARDDAVSPEVYWARNPRLDQWTPLTVQVEDGIHIHVPAEVTAYIEDD